MLAADPRFGEPTLGVLVGDELLLVVNSPWAYYDDPANPPALEDLPLPLVLKLEFSPGSRDESR